MHCACDARQNGNVKTSNVGVVVQKLQNTAHDVGIVLLDNGGTARGRVQYFACALLRTLLNWGASFRSQNLTITFDNEVSESIHGRV